MPFSPVQRARKLEYMWLVVGEKSKGDRRVAYFSAVLGTLLVIFGQDARKKTGYQMSKLRRRAMRRQKAYTLA